MSPVDRLLALLPKGQFFGVFMPAPWLLRIFEDEEFIAERSFEHDPTDAELTAWLAELGLSPEGRPPK